MDNTSNPWTIDAADVVASDVEVWHDEAYIYQVEFQDYNADTDTCIVNQLNGKIFWFGNGAADLETVRSGNVGWAHGIKVPMGGITNGSVRIYHK
jgi:hypothetical protein